jgi:hypothetical protein
MGSNPVCSQSSGEMRENSARVGSCHDQRRLDASSPTAPRRSGSTDRTVNLLIAFTKNLHTGAPPPLVSHPAVDTVGQALPSLGQARAGRINDREPFP